MARQKRTSPAIRRASARATGLASISNELDLGNGFTLASYQEAIDKVQAQLDAYNTDLSKLDGKLDDLEKSESALDTLSSKMLAAVGVKYDKDSKEYEQAGGTRTSEHASADSSETTTETQSGAAKT